MGFSSYRWKAGDAPEEGGRDSIDCIWIGSIMLYYWPAAPGHGANERKLS